MLFSSITFIILFLPVVLLLYYICPFFKGKNIILLLASLLFYAWGEPKFVLVMLFSIVVNYGMGLLIANVPNSDTGRKPYLVAGIIFNLLILFFFKYLGFAEEILNSIIRTFHISNSQLTVLQVILPLGISFYTFQSLSYLIDVYRKPAMVERNILNLGLFISFFPQLIAGPIVRFHDINEQIKERKHSLDLFTRGIERFIVGLAKKVLIANTMAEVVDGILALPFETIPSVYMLLITVAGVLQIYYDFSGYSDMAIGLGRMFGFKIMENFDYPLATRSSTEFWRRWHISLSSWFRDYLYFPLGGSRKGPARQALNVLIVFTLVGLWHGAAFNFIFFGLVCGIWQIAEDVIKEKTKNFFVNKSKWVLLTKSVLVYMLYTVLRIALFMYFRLDLKSSVSFYANFFNFTRDIPVPLEILFLTDIRFYIFFVSGIIFLVPWWRKLPMPENKVTAFVKYVLLLGLFFLSFGTLTTDAYNPFIYFRF
jgi:alginate O-acetyltransferase complex protein AlgI